MSRVRSVAREAYFRLLEALGRREARVRALGDDGTLVVLNLHKVSPEPNPFWNPLHPDLLDGLLRFLVERFQVTTFRELGRLDGARPAVVLSFDDGYQDFADHAMPLLDAHGVRANQNVIGSCVTSGVPPWNVRLYDFLATAPRRLVEELRLPGFTAPTPGDDDLAKMRYALALSGFLKHRPRQEREPLWSVVEDLTVRGDDHPRTQMMNTEQVREAATVHEIGAHSWSHESMAHESDEFFRADLAQCSRFFEQDLGIPLDVYAFPNGSYRQSQVDTLLDTGIAHVLLVDEDSSTRAGPVHPRFTLYGDSPAELRMRAVGYRRDRGS